MTQDLSGKNLQGQSFRGQDLRGVNFSRADIRGVDFRNAILIGANFSQARAGLPLPWALGLILLSFSLSICAGLACAFAGAFPHYLLMAAAVEQYTVVPGLMVLGLFLVFALMLLWRGIAAALTWTALMGVFAVSMVLLIVKASTVASLFAQAVAIALLFSGLVAIVGVGVEAAAGVGAMVLTLIFLLAVTIAAAFALTGWLAQGDEASLALVLAVSGTIAGAGTFAIAGVFGTAIGAAGMIAGVSTALRTIAGGDVVLEAAVGLLSATTAILIAGSAAGWVAATIAGGFVSLGIYVGQRSLRPGGRRFQLLRQSVLALLVLKGTQFGGADLTNATFHKAVLPCTDFRAAKLQSVVWSQALQLRRAQFDQTLLPSPADTH